MLRELHWLPVAKRIEFKFLCFAHNCYYNSSAPSYLVEITQKKENTGILRSNNNCNVVNNLSNTKFGDRAFGNCAPLLWNRLHIKLKTVKNIVVFNKLLKHIYLFNTLVNYICYSCYFSGRLRPVRGCYS